MRFTTKLLPSRSGNLGILQLNNPRPLHALTLDMIQCMDDVLEQWYADDSLVALLVKSSRETKTPAFCAGGDVKRVYFSGKEDAGTHGQGVHGLHSADFFRQEYDINYRLATATKPQISFWDGLVMGGGVGISIYGKYRVATENTVFAMPETKIGLFPDVGSMFWMPRLLSESQAVYLALTGHRLKAADLMYTGLATHYVPSDQLPSLEQALVDASLAADEDDNQNSNSSNLSHSGERIVAPVLLSFHQNPPEDPQDSILAKERETIERHFGGMLSGSNKTSRVSDIMASLQKEKNNSSTSSSSKFGNQALQTLEQMSPTSLDLTLAGLRRGALCSDIGEDLRMEYRMVQACIRTDKDTRSDFYEGIRAALVDKDGTPRWNPSRIEDVTEEMVNLYFSPIEHEWNAPVRTEANASTS